MSSNGTLCAKIVKLKKDSLSEKVGHLRIGDEIVEWNGHVLRGLTNDQVLTIVSNSKHDEEIHLLVERELRSTLNYTNGSSK